MTKEDYIHYCIDIGSVNKSRFAWARLDSRSQNKLIVGNCINEICEKINEDLKKNIPLTIGIEAPLFIPVPFDNTFLGKARQNEGNRAWSAGAGSAVAILGLQQVAFILKMIMIENYSIETSWKEFCKQKQKKIFFWEAFVTGENKTREEIEPHIRDSISAVIEIHHRITGLKKDEDLASDINVLEEEEVLSLFGAAVIFASKKNYEGIKSPLTVIRPTVPHGDDYDIS